MWERIRSSNLIAYLLLTGASVWVAVDGIALPAYRIYMTWTTTGAP